MFSKFVHYTGERRPRFSDPGSAISDSVVVQLLVAAGREEKENAPTP
jgi:hypothetical protein